MNQKQGRINLTECEPLVDRVLDFAAVLLRYASTPYPFAVIHSAGSTQCVFTDGDDQRADHPSLGMIEQLEWLITDHNFQTPSTSSVVCYSATLETEQNDVADVLVVKIDDGEGQETTRLYPYTLERHGIHFGRPLCY